jgi:hypothetical protein
MCSAIRAALYRAISLEKQTPGQHQGPITAAYQRALLPLLWQFLSYKDGLCSPPMRRLRPVATLPCNLFARRILGWAFF